MTSPTNTQKNKKEKNYVGRDTSSCINFISYTNKEKGSTLDFFLLHVTVPKGGAVSHKGICKRRSGDIKMEARDEVQVVGGTHWLKRSVPRRWCVTDFQLVSLQRSVCGRCAASNCCPGLAFTIFGFN